jgi:protease II
VNHKTRKKGILRVKKSARRSNVRDLRKIAILIRTDCGASGRFSRLEEVAFSYAFAVKAASGATQPSAA